MTGFVWSVPLVVERCRFNGHPAVYSRPFDMRTPCVLLYVHEFINLSL
jgi:hypothetical protein